MFDWAKIEVLMRVFDFVEWLTSRLWASATCFNTFASSQTYACNIQERAYHSYHVWGMTYLKKMFHVQGHCNFRKTEIYVFSDRDIKFST